MGIGTSLFRFHRAVIDPERRGPVLASARAGLRVLAAGYGLGVRLRNATYRVAPRRRQRAGVPVISVGNITAGGTGKTPLVAYLAHLLHIHRRRPAILSRGYGHHEGSGVDDENAMLGRMAGHTPVVVDADRVRGARTAIERHDADVLILDDGFQHRRLARDLDIVLIDALHPFGAGHLLPRGLLREPLTELGRAGLLLITRAGLVGFDRLAAIRARLHELAPGVPTAACRTVPTGLLPLGTGAEDAVGLDVLREGRWGAFCGIGNPDGFRGTLAGTGADLAFLDVFGDHHDYTRPDVDAVLARASSADCTGVVTTEKDAVKVERLLRGAPRPPVYALRTDLDFVDGAEALTTAVVEATRRPA